MEVVYVISNQNNEKLYVGRTKCPLEKRLRAHVVCSVKGLHGVLYSAIREHGEDAFSINRLESFATHKEACDGERRWVARLATKVPNGDNVADGGIGSRGFRHSVEFKAAMSLRLQGHATSSETRSKIAEANRGQKRSPKTKQRLRDAWVRRKAAGPVSNETRAKMSAALSGRVFSDAHCKNISASKLGLKASDEAKANMRAAKVGCVLSDEHKASLSKAGLGKRHSEATRQKMRDSWEKRRNARPPASPEESASLT